MAEDPRALKIGNAIDATLALCKEHKLSPLEAASVLATVIGIGARRTFEAGDYAGFNTLKDLATQIMEDVSITELGDRK